MRKRMTTAAAVALLAVTLGGVVRTATAGPSPATTEIVVLTKAGTGVTTFLDLLRGRAHADVDEMGATLDLVRIEP